MAQILLIFFGAGLGGVLRYGMSTSLHRMLGTAFPYGTLFVNVSGCLLMGLLFTLLIERLDGVSSLFRAFLLVGLLGGYTTFSTFSIETYNLIESGAWVNAFLNILFNMVLCIFATFLGVIGGRQL